MVQCALLVPGPDGVLDFWEHDNALNAVHLAWIDEAEWLGLSQWAQFHATDLPALAGLLAHIPVRVTPTGVSALAQECERVDWDSLSGPALEGFASLSLVVSQAVGQVGCGLQFVSDAEPCVLPDCGGMV